MRYATSVASGSQRVRQRRRRRMKNPLRDEASAFRVVFLTLAGAVLVAVGAWINTWLGLVVFLVLVAVALWAIRGGMRPGPPQAHVVHDGGPARKILVVA